jgi:hypothetical protein
VLRGDLEGGRSNLLRTRMREDSIELKGFLESVLSVHRCWKSTAVIFNG